MTRPVTRSVVAPRVAGAAELGESRRDSLRVGG